MSQKNSRSCCEQSYIPLVSGTNSLWKSGYISNSNCGLIILVFTVVIFYYSRINIGWLRCKDNV